MKKTKPVIIVVGGLLLLLLLLMFSARQRPRKLNERITLHSRDKIPYGTYAAQHLLPALFPQATITKDQSSPGYWKTIAEDSTDQALILVTRNFDADELELQKLIGFARNGNYVFIIAKALSADANHFFHTALNQSAYDDYNEFYDSLTVYLLTPPFKQTTHYLYPGKRFESYFERVDTNITTVLGTTALHKPNFIQLHSGKGKFFVHLAPLTFSNYFVLHKNNYQYFQNSLSVIPPTVKKVVWSEYYLNKPQQNNEEEPNLFRVLFQYPSFKWALITAIFTLLVYVLLQMRRRQRLIPVYQKPANESLAFVKTIGRLYYDRRDHRNLAKKMSMYFLEHVRTRYKLSTQTLDDAFVASLFFKSGYPTERIQSIVEVIKNVEHLQVTDTVLFNFHKQLEHFYQNT